jgi:hypothetical protein
LQELNAAQAVSRTAADFLRNFVCIEAAPLPRDVDFFHYIQPSSYRESPFVKFKTPADGPTRTAEHPVIGQGWLRGSALLAKFRNGEIGVRLDLRVGTFADGEKLPNRAVVTEVLDRATKFSESEFGVLVRTPVA